MESRLFARRGAFAGCVALGALLATGSGAFAQCTPTLAGPPALSGFLATAGVAGGAAAGAFAGALGNLSTAFLTQQGSAFVSAPGDPKPDQPGGGVWVRGVGGEVKNNFSSSFNSGISVAGVPTASAAATGCTGSVKQSFGGLQVGQDISRLNWSGWNVHLGTTAGYLGAHSNASTGATSDFEVPFLGAYIVATKGRFFADLMIRKEFYTANLTDASVGLLGQQIGAHGISVATSAGYNFALANNWFIEPSAGFIWSKTDVDPFNVSGGGFVSTFTTSAIESEIGRLTVRAGTTINSGNIIWQPFASASVFHEFAGNVNTAATSLTNAAFVGPFPATISGTNTTSRVGTYGQYSLGLAAQVANTGFLGFVRVDYRNGENIDGWTGNAGIRYQFSPETIASVMPFKAPVKALPPAVTQSDWTGFYVGGFLGVATGRTDIGFPAGNPATSGTAPRVFGGIGGLQAGYNRQFANKWVVGIEGDIGAANIHGSRTAGTDSGLDAGGAPVAFSPAFFTAQDKTNWQGTLTGRLGYAWGRTLFYGKGGVAFEDSATTMTCIFGPTGTAGARACLNPALALTGQFGTSYYTRVGGVVGYGTEFDLGKNWSAKAEYDYLFFGRHSATANDGTVVTDKAWSSQVKVGVNYRFAPTAVIAKY
jgi:outer membrane autotransporter protein